MLSSRGIKICIYIIISFMQYAYTQGNPNKLVENAKDSLISNPNYSYNILSKLSKRKKIHDSIRLKVNITIGEYFNSIGVPDSAEYYAKKALLRIKLKSQRGNSLKETINLQKKTATIYRIIGSGYRISGKIDKAIEILFKSLEISEKIHYKEMISKVKSDLGILYGNKNELDKAIQFFKESIDHAYNDQAIYANYVNIGSIYFFKKDFDNAEKYFIQAFELMPLEKDPKVSATIALNIGSVLFENKKYIKAINYYEKSKNIADNYGFKDKGLNAIVHKALALDALGNSGKAINTLVKTLPEAKKIRNLEVQKNIHENLASIYTTIGNHKLANSSLIEFYKLKDSISNTKQRKEITELEIKYETTKKEKEILALKENQLIKDNEISRQRLLKRSSIIVFLIVLIPISALLIVYYQKLKVQNQYNLQKEEIHKQKINSVLKEQELKLANTYTFAQNEERNRIASELHDSVGGNLAAIKLQMAGRQEEIHKEKDTILDQLDNVYEQVRQISHNLTPKKLCNSSFTKYISDYIDTIENVTEPEITFIPHPVDKIDKLDEKYKPEIFKVIQELLTNALKYANAKHIEICFNVYENDLEVIFEDDGIGFSVDTVTSGIGLQNIKNRLSKMYGEIHIDSVINRGTAIRIKIPTYNEIPQQI